MLVSLLGHLKFQSCICQQNQTAGRHVLVVDLAISNPAPTTLLGVGFYNKQIHLRLLSCINPYPVCSWMYQYFVFRVSGLTTEDRQDYSLIQEDSQIGCRCHDLVSGVMCHVSGGRCQVSGVTFFIIFFLTKCLGYLVEGLLSTGPTPSFFFSLS